jgi:hypothetical protein
MGQTTSVTSRKNTVIGRPPFFPLKSLERQLVVPVPDVHVHAHESGVSLNSFHPCQTHRLARWAESPNALSPSSMEVSAHLSDPQRFVVCFLSSAELPLGSRVHLSART